MGNGLNHHGFPMEILQQARTPFYYYDLDVLRKTLDEINRLTADDFCTVHYAVKANGNPHILKEIKDHGLGVDLVSGGEIEAALKAGFLPSEMTYSGVGKTDWEIRLGLSHDIAFFNVESVPELEVINLIAQEMDTTAHVAIRVNPDIDAHTHKFITTGTADNKFGICLEDLEHVIKLAIKLSNINLKGLHFHIGSQIVDMKPYQMLCETVNRLMDDFERQGIVFESINVGGGLGIDYAHPDERPVPELERFINTFKQGLHLRKGQKLHFELGRSIVGQCGSLICRVLYVKENRNKKFAIVDAGMTDLIRPALYEASHRVQNLTSGQEAVETYDVVGPVCESSDVFAHDCPLPVTRRGDLIAIRSAGAYGESMASTYNMRLLPLSVFGPR